MALLVSIIYTVGVVWRVELRLDISYKFFLTGIAFLLGAEVSDVVVFPGTEVWFEFASIIGRTVFSICFLIGVWHMRRIIRNLDGERFRRESHIS